MAAFAGNALNAYPVLRGSGASNSSEFAAKVLPPRALGRPKDEYSGSGSSPNRDARLPSTEGAVRD